MGEGKQKALWQVMLRIHSVIVLKVQKEIVHLVFELSINIHTARCSDTGYKKQKMGVRRPLNALWINPIRLTEVKRLHQSFQGDKIPSYQKLIFLLSST